MRTVVIPTDFSANAMNAIKYAVQLFKYERCIIYFMHVYADEVYNHDVVLTAKLFDEFKEKVASKTDKLLQELLVQVKEISPNPRHRYHVLPVFGSLVDAVNDFVDQENIDIVVMGTKGKTNDKTITFGSHTLQVLKYVQCPVLAIPENYTYTQPKNILFPTDYMLPYKRRELKLLYEIADSYRSEIHFLYISKFEKLCKRQEDNKLFLEGCLCLPKAKLLFNTVDNDDMPRTIKKQISDNNIQMLVMVNSRHSFLESILYQSTIDKIGLTIQVPFMVMQNLSR